MYFLIMIENSLLSKGGGPYIPWKDQTVEDCKWNENKLISYANNLIFSLSIASLLVVLWQICILEHGTRRVNFLTSRPWRTALIILFLIAIKAISNEIYMSWDWWLFIERLCKLLNIYFGLTLALEKHILALFMIYQVHFNLNQHDVMKDKFRSLE